MSKLEDAALPHDSLNELKTEDLSPQYPIGTRILKYITRWGLCEGIIDSFDGEYYNVKYLSINFQERLAPAKMADDVTITTNWDSHLLDEGQQIWAFMGKGVHSGVIMSIRRPDNRASVKWDSTTKVSEVDLDTLFPMFDYDNEGSMLISRHSKRRRFRTNFFHLGNQGQAPRAIQTQNSGNKGKRSTQNEARASEQSGKGNSHNKAVAVKGEGEKKSPETTQDFERELSMLSEYYLDKKVRKNEEIPNGMVLRAKIVRCPLLRSKSEFRRIVHKRILVLQRAGKKSEIHRILKKLHDHDISGQSGEGPSDLLEEFSFNKEFLEKETNQTHDDVEIVQPNQLYSAPEVVITEDLSVGMSFDRTTLSSLSESPPVTASALLDDHTKVENQMVGNYPNNKSDSSLGTNDSTRLIDLIDDSVDSKLPALESYGMEDDTKLIELVYGTVERKLPATVLHDCHGITSFSTEASRTIGKACVSTAARSVNCLDIIDLTEEDSSCKLPASYVSAVREKEKSLIEIIDLMEDDCNEKPIGRSEPVDMNVSFHADLVSSRAQPTDKLSLVEVVNLLEDD